MNKLLALTIGLAGLGACQASAQLGGTGTAGPPPPQPAQPAQPAASTTGTTGAAGAAVEHSASCPNPANHCLPDGQHFFVAKKGWTRNYEYVNIATQQTPPDGAGEAKFFLRKDGSEMVSKWSYTSSPLDPSDVIVGQMVIMFHDNSQGKVYHPPKTAEDALGKRWWMARVTSIAPMATDNTVLVSGGYKVAADNLRLIDGDQSATMSYGGTEDTHFITPDLWLVSEKPLNNGSYNYVDLAAAIALPSAKTKNEGHFMRIKEGSQVWSSNAWRTRPAAQGEVKVGTRVFMFHDNSQGKVYQKPRDRREALTKRYWTAVVTDDSNAFKGTVTVAGKYQVALDNLRVPVQ